jgi:hypothetical protein
MAKLITEPVQITLQHGDTRQTYSAGYGSLSGNGADGIDISVNSARLISSQTKPKGTQWVPVAGQDFRATAPEQCPHEKALIGAAKAQERATLNAARIIEKAHEQAEALINDADHTLNGAIQAYLHTSKTAVDVARVLDRAGIYYNEVRGENVASLNTPDLYLLDATELLTVG